jgi:hypothetical protein
MEKQTNPIQIVEVAARWYAAAMVSLYAIGKSHFNTMIPTIFSKFYIIK